MRPEILNPLFAEAEVLKGVGPQIAKLLKRLDLTRLVDVLYHLPTGAIERVKARLAEIIEKVNTLFEGELTENDKLVYVNDVLLGKLLESELLAKSIRRLHKGGRFGRLQRTGVQRRRSRADVTQRSRLAAHRRRRRRRCHHCRRVSCTGRPGPRCWR